MLREPRGRSFVSRAPVAPPRQLGARLVTGQRSSSEEWRALRGNNSSLGRARGGSLSSTCSPDVSLLPARTYLTGPHYHNHAQPGEPALRRRELSSCRCKAAQRGTIAARFSGGGSSVTWKTERAAAGRPLSMNGTLPALPAAAPRPASPADVSRAKWPPSERGSALNHPFPGKEARAENNASVVAFPSARRRAGIPRERTVSTCATEHGRGDAALSAGDTGKARAADSPRTAATCALHS